jgi:ankyrin repeat protein
MTKFHKNAQAVDLISSIRSSQSFSGIAAINVVNLLLEKGADVDTKDRDGITALVISYDAARLC